MPLSLQQKIGVDATLKSILEGLGHMPPLPNDFGLFVGGKELNATISNMSLDVNVATGNDANGDGSPNNPFASITRAISAVPLIRRHLITIRVFAGTYVETIRDSGIYEDNGLFTGGLLIQAQSFTTPTLGSGSITTGTLGNAPAQGITRTVAGAAWNTNELKGFLAKITSGTLNGQYFPILANAAGTLDIPNTSASLNGATFNIVIPACIITNGPGLFTSAMISNSGAPTTANACQIQGFKLQSGSFYGAYCGAGSLQLTECVIAGQSLAGVNCGSPLTQVALSRCYVVGGAGVGVSGSHVQQFFAGGTGFDGGTSGIQITSVARMGCNASGHVVCQNASGPGIDIRGGPFYLDSFVAQKFICRNNGTGIQLQGGAHMLMQSCEITNNTGHGIRLLANNSVTCHNSLHMFGCKVQNNGGDGIRVETSHNNIMFGGGDISGNAGFGVNFGGQPAGYVSAGFNGAAFDGSVTMGTNVSGDITIDNGATNKSIAQVRSDTQEVNASLFNRVQAI